MPANAPRHRHHPFATRVTPSGRPVGCAPRTASPAPGPGKKPHRHQLGFSYLETLIAVLLIAVSLAPIMAALDTAILGLGVQDDLAAGHYRLSGRMEELLAEDFAALDAAATAAGGATVASSYSDSAGTELRRLVYLSRYDADNADADNDPFTGTEADLIWLRVALENSPQALQSLSYR